MARQDNHFTISRQSAGGYQLEGEIGHWHCRPSVNLVKASKDYLSKEPRSRINIYQIRNGIPYPLEGVDVRRVLDVTAEVQGGLITRIEVIGWTDEERTRTYLSSVSEIFEETLDLKPN